MRPVPWATPGNNGVDPDEQGADPIAAEVTAALARRAAGVRGRELKVARDAVDARLVQRAHIRARRRRTGGATAVAVAVVTVVALGLPALRDGDPDVASGPSSGSTLPSGPPPEAGVTSTDPADVGLPRIVVDPSAGLSPVGDVPPTARTTEAGERVGEQPDELLVLRRPDAPTPVVFVPAPGSGSGELPPVPEDQSAPRTVEVDGGREGTLRGTESGWVTLSWPTAAGGSEETLTAWAYGVDDETLTRLVADLRPGGDVGGDLPEAPASLPGGFQAQTVTSPPDAVAAEYTTNHESADGRTTVIVDVLNEPQLLREQRLALMLSDVTTTEATRLLGQDAMIARSADGAWTVVTAPDPTQPDLAVAIRATGVTRPELDDILPTIHTATLTEWQSAYE